MRGSLLLVLACLLPAHAATAAPAAPLSVRVATRGLQPGELVVVALSFAAEPEHVAVKAFGIDVPAYRVSERVWQALVGIDLDRHPGRYPLTVDATTAAGPIHHERTLVVRTKAFRTRVLRVDPSFVTPPEEVRARLEEEAAFLRGVYATPSKERLWEGPFVRPVRGAANSAFGTRSVFNGEPRGAHAGADFASGAGTPIKAPAGGRVVAARPLYYSGYTVIVDHGLGLFSMLGHMSHIEVREGDRVETGAIVGRVGATGRVTGPHLHWSLRVGDARVDPLSALALLGAPSPRTARSPGRRR